MLTKLSFFWYGGFTPCYRKPSNLLDILYSEWPLTASVKHSFHTLTFLSLQCVAQENSACIRGHCANYSTVNWNTPPKILYKKQIPQQINQGTKLSKSRIFEKHWFINKQIIFKPLSWFIFNSVVKSGKNNIFVWDTVHPRTAIRVN